MMPPLNDERLESLRCSKCRKYLSLFPIKNHSNGEVTCGRCSSDDDNGVRSHLYELVAEKYLFRCVNRYEGCKELLQADETAAHEQKCAGRAYCCPKCEDGVERSVLELIWHYKIDHPSSCLKGSCFNVRPQSEDIMLYVQNDVVFFISIRYVTNVLYLSAMTLIEMDGTQVFLINKGHVWKKSEKKLCMPTSAFEDNNCVFRLDLIGPIKVIFCLEVSKGDGIVPSTSKGQVRSRKASTAPQQKFKIKLAPELKNKLGYMLNEHGTALLDDAGSEIDLTCTNCKQLIGRTVFRCVESDHQICHNCRAWCGICNCFVVSAATDDPLNLLNSYLRYPCKWQCGDYSSKEILLFPNTIHEETTCKFKVLKCPICPFKMNLSDLELMKIHLSGIHQIIYFGEEYDIGKIERIINENNNGTVYFMFHNKYCYLKWSYRRMINYNRKCYDFTFGLFDNEPNIKLGVVHHDFSFSYCRNNIQDCNIDTLRDYLPYINFN